MSLLWPPLQLRSLQHHQSVTNSIFRLLALHHENRDCLVASSSRRLLSVNIGPPSPFHITRQLVVTLHSMNEVSTNLSSHFLTLYLFLRFGCFRIYLVLFTHLIICHLDVHYTKSLYACLPLPTHINHYGFDCCFNLSISFSSSFIVLF